MYWKSYWIEEDKLGLKQMTSIDKPRIGTSKWNKINKGQSWCKRYQHAKERKWRETWLKKKKKIWFYKEVNQFRDQKNLVICKTWDGNDVALHTSQQKQNISECFVKPNPVTRSSASCDKVTPDYSCWSVQPGTEITHFGLLVSIFGSHHDPLTEEQWLNLL